MTAPVQQGFPRLDSPLIDGLGNCSIPWYRFFIQLYKLSGGQGVPLNQGVYFIQSPPGTIGAYNVNGGFIADVALTNSPGPPSVPVTPGPNPYVYTATGEGTLTVYGGFVELKRGTGSYVPVSRVGGAIPMLAGDMCRTTWYGATPQMEFFPRAQTS